MSEQIVWVDTDLCTGCGVCVDACPSGAIGLVNEKAHIDVAECTGCGICIGACPEEAILPEVKSTVEGKLMTVEPSNLVKLQRRDVQPSRTVSGTLTLLGSALAFVGREILPRLAVSLLDAWDRRPNRPLPFPGDSTPAHSSHQPTSSLSGRKGRQHRWRRRGDR